MCKVIVNCCCRGGGDGVPVLPVAAAVVVLAVGAQVVAALVTILYWALVTATSLAGIAAAVVVTRVIQCWRQERQLRLTRRIEMEDCSSRAPIFMESVRLDQLPSP